MSSILNLRIGNETSTKILQDDVLKHQGNDKLFEVVKQYTAQEDWKQGIDTASLYTEIVEDHAGTLENPIPYEHWMIIDKDLYYIENDILYQGLLDAPNGYDADLNSLPSITKKIEQ